MSDSIKRLYYEFVEFYSFVDYGTAFCVKWGWCKSILMLIDSSLVYVSN